MKILWVATDFPHPAVQGRRIRTLEMLRRLHARHEIHYAAIEDPRYPEAPVRAAEYAARVYPFRHRMAGRHSPLFALEEAARGWFDPMPVAMRRYCSPALGRFLEQLAARERFDRLVADSLPAASCFPDLEHGLLFQHHVETMLAGQQAQHATGFARRLYFRMQANRMFEYEREVCRRAGHVVAVSSQDADTLRRLFGVTRVSAVPTGVDIGFYTPLDPPPVRAAGLVFLGAMDSLPNIDSVEWFVSEVLPLIHSVRPECTLAIVGHKPPRPVKALSGKDARIQVTGTVPDVRPYLWSAAVSIVPLRMGGGARLTVYESMAARVPVVATSAGAEGLDVHPPEDMRIADTAEDFAAACLELLDDRALAGRQAAAAWEMAGRLSWENAARRFERIMEDTA